MSEAERLIEVFQGIQKPRPLDWFMNIKRVGGGYVIEYNDVDNNMREVVSTEVIGLEDDNKCNEAFKRLLYMVMDHFGELGSKHDEHRLLIKCSCGEDE